MNIVKLLRLLSKNFILVLLSGAFVSFTIFYLTRNQPKKYKSSATIHTGFRTGYDIESTINKGNGYYKTLAMIENFVSMIKSRETQEATAYRLLALHIIEDTKTPDKYTHLNKIIAVEKRQKLVDTSSIDITVKNIKDYINKNDDNELQKLFASSHTFYGISKLSNVKVDEIEGSDLIELSYESIHPKICQQTVTMFVEVIIQNYIEIDKKQATTVIKYFENRVSEAQKRLNTGEQEMQKFIEDNEIINFEAQTTSITSQKELMETELQNEKMQLVAAQAAIKNLENKMTDKVNKSLQSSQYTSILNQLTWISDKIENIKVFDKDNTKELSMLEENKLQLKEELAIAQKSIYQNDRTPEGIKMQEILSKWLNNVIKISETQSRLKTFKEREKKFQENYDKFAPLGSILKKKERAISIIEKEYLVLLTNLNASRLKQQNAEFASNIKVFSPAYFPTHAKASKRKFLVLVGFVVGVIIFSAILIFIEFLDNSIKTTERIRNFTQLPLLSQYPYFPKKIIKSIDYKFIKHRITEIAVQKLILSLGGESNTPKIIGIFSSRIIEGKTFLSYEISNKLSSQTKVLLISPKVEARPEILSENIVLNEYEPEDNDSVNSINNYINEATNKSEYGYIIIEMLPFLKNEIPIDIVNQTNMSIMVCRSDRKWTIADTQALDLYKQIVKHKPFVFLNGVVLNALEEQLGEIPRKRSIIRKIAKRIATFQIGAKRKF